MTLVFIILGLLAFAGFLAWKGWYESRQTMIRTSDLTATPSSVVSGDEKIVYGVDREGNKIYEIMIPADWTELEHSSNFYYLNNFRAPDESGINIIYQAANGRTLEQFLKDIDQDAKVAYEGQPATRVVSSRQTSLAGYPAVEREEDLLAAGLKQFVTYVLIKDKVYSIAFQKTNYPQILTTFRPL